MWVKQWLVFSDVIYERGGYYECKYGDEFLAYTKIFKNGKYWWYKFAGF